MQTLLAAEGPSPGPLRSLAGLETGAGLMQRRTKPGRSAIVWPGALEITASKKVLKTPSERLSPQIPILVDQLHHLLLNTTVFAKKGAEWMCGLAASGIPWPPRELDPRDLCHLPNPPTGRWENPGHQVCALCSWG